jgi:hypothetical protein
MMDLTAYPLDVMYGNLPKIEAKNVIVVIDACFSGGTNTGKWLVPNASPALSLHPRSGWAQDAPSKGAGMSNIDYMNFEVMVVRN